MKLKQETFAESSTADNMYCGDTSRVIAAFSSNSLAASHPSFGKLAALCGNSALVQEFLEVNKGQMIMPLYQCVEGSCMSGDLKCLEVCLHMLTTATKSHYMDSARGSMMWMVNYFIGRCSLEQIHPFVFEWISCKWSNEEILSVVADINLWTLRKQSRLSCSDALGERNASILMYGFSLVGSLAGFKWLQAMGVKSVSGVVQSVRKGHMQIPEYLINTHRISMCHRSASLMLTSVLAQVSSGASKSLCFLPQRTC